MNLLTPFFKWFYIQSLKLYPIEFRSRFGAEMEDVYIQATRENNAIIFCLRELKDLPGSLIYQYWAAFRKEKAIMTTLPKTNGIQIDPPQPGTWARHFLPACPTC